jgi:hypothetical protein
VNGAFNLICCARVHHFLLEILYPAAHACAVPKANDRNRDGARRARRGVTGLCAIAAVRTKRIMFLMAVGDF